MKKPPVVILHGWGLSAEHFGGLAQEFRKDGYKTFTLDFPGFGKSDIPSHSLSLADYASFLSDYLTSNKISQPVLIGHSFGGRVALKLNELFPNIVRALVLTGVPGFTPIPKRRLALFILVAKIGGLLFSIPPFSLFKKQVQRWYYYVVGAKEFFRAQGSMRETFKRIVAEDLVSSMESVSIPCLLVWGELDIIVPLSIAKRMQGTIKGAQLVVIPGIDHGVPYKHPNIFKIQVTRFLEGL